MSEAEDAVQETWLRYEASPTQPASAKAFLSAVVTRISIDVLRSARVRREEYVGPWFPEPLLTDPYEDPARSAELADSVSMAALLLLERLSPLERAVFVLREVFGFGFSEVASAVGRSEAACRQLAVRARRHMDAGRPRFEADRKEREELAARFFEALREGDIDGLRELLAADVQLIGDGGGKVPQLAQVDHRRAQRGPGAGHEHAWFVQVDVTLEQHEVNGQPARSSATAPARSSSPGPSTSSTEGSRPSARAQPRQARSPGPVADAWAISREADRRAGPQTDRKSSTTTGRGRELNRRE